MTDPLLTLVVLAGFLILMALMHFFKTLDGDLAAAWRTPFLAGLAAGIVLRLTGAQGPLFLGLLLSMTALWSRHTGQESEPIEGMVMGSAMGAAAALPLLFGSDFEARIAASSILAGAVAGFGITFAASHVAAKLRQFLLDGVTAAVAVGAASLPKLLATGGIQDQETLLAVAALLPLAVLVSLFQQWPDVRAELRHEASLGFLDDADVRTTAHPILRLGRGGWTDPRAHREFVQLANRVALRKRQQRGRSDEMARLYQLEIIKLRMRIQEMSRIDHAVLTARRDEHMRSDTMASSK